MLAVVKYEGAVDDAHRLVDGGKGGCTLDVDVDVTRDDRLDSVGVTAELTGAEDLDRQANVGSLGDLLDHGRAANYLRLGVLVAVGKDELDLFLCGCRRGGRSFSRGSRSLRRRSAGCLFGGRGLFRPTTTCGQHEKYCQREGEDSGSLTHIFLLLSPGNRAA